MPSAQRSQEKKLRWGILGTGAIARQFAEALAHSSSGELAAVASRSAVPLGTDAFRGARFYTGYERLLEDEAVDAVYIATPHPMHAQWAIRTAEAGKHLLCEKPIGMNAAEATAIFDAAKLNGVFALEAFMYRAHAQTRLIADLLRSGCLGQVRLIRASYGYCKAFDPELRHFANNLGGGAILDVGCYLTSMSRLVAGIALGKDFSDPVELHASAKFVETGVDEYATASLRFEGDIIAQIACSITTVLDNKVCVFGTDGWLEIPSPWFCSGRQGGRSVVRLHERSGKTEEIVVETADWLYAVEADAFAEGVATGKPRWPVPDAADSIGNMRTLDSWRQAVGLQYESEAPGRSRTNFAGRPVVRLATADMRYTCRPDVGKRLSELAIGCMGIRTMPDAQAVYDAFFEAGGTVFDTAHIYLKGLADELLGHWISSRGLRREVVVIGKGAHSPNCFPDAIEPELNESLERLQTDYVDIYLLHRDNPDVPVGEFVDALNRLRRAGRMRVFGGSNWSIERIDAANAYAVANGLMGFQAISNQFSLAEMIEPVWAGCISASDDASIDWLRRTKMPLFAWSSQARGFFTDRVNPRGHTDPVFVRSWFSQENLARRERAARLAASRGVDMQTVALAYVLAQDFSVTPIIGPLTIQELRTSLEATKLRLTPDEVSWLRHGIPKLEI